VQEILSHVPAGPLTLVGHSFGGTAAMELAAQLPAAGREVARVVLLDAGAPIPVAAPPLFDTIAILRLYADALELNMAPDHLDGRSEEEAINQVAAAMASAGIAWADPKAWLRAVLQSSEASHRMLETWKPRVPQAPIHLLRAEARSPSDPRASSEDLG